MSRVGKNPVVIPAGVTIELQGQHLKAKGKRGELQLVVHDDVTVAREGEALVFEGRAMSYRLLASNGGCRDLRGFRPAADRDSCRSACDFRRASI